MPFSSSICFSVLAPRYFLPPSLSLATLAEGEDAKAVRPGGINLPATIDAPRSALTTYNEIVSRWWKELESLKKAEYVRREREARARHNVDVEAWEEARDAA